MTAEKRSITLDTEEIKEAAENGSTIVTRRYVDGELLEFSIDVRK